MEISTNGYAFPFIDHSTLRMTLPYLTYLTIFYYRITMDGDIEDIDDQELIDMAKGYGVAPIMIISTLTEKGVADVVVAHSIFTNLERQERLIDNVIETMKAKDYYGLNLDIQKIRQEDRQLYLDFVRNLSERVKQEGYILITTLTPNTFISDTEAMYQGPEYAIIGELSDSNMLLSYEWGYTYSPRSALPLNQVRALIEYSIAQIPPEKISIGLPTVGYIWHLPYIQNVSIANAISNRTALALARDIGVAIEHDLESMAPYFSYFNGIQHVVWFRDSRNIFALLEFVVEYDLGGIGTWNIMQFSSDIWMVINAQFEIKKVL
jgi:spore germination protein